jgi:hypothetical protein
MHRHPQNIVTNLVKIITNLGADVTAMQATPPFIDAVAGPIVDALKEVPSDAH